jgi:hypothetical protein
MSALVVVYTTATGGAVSLGSVEPPTLQPGLSVVTFASPSWEEFRGGGWRWDAGTLAPVVVPPGRDVAGELVAALAADPPVQEEILVLLAETSGGVVAAAAPDVSTRRQQLHDDVALLRTMAATARADIAAMPATGRTAAQREQAKLRRYLLALTRLLSNAVLRPIAEDLGGIPE